MIDREITRFGETPMIVETFHSVEEFFDGAVRRYKGGDSSSKRGCRADAALRHAVEFGIPGQSAEAMQIADAAVKTSDQITRQAAFQLTPDVSGDYVDVPTFLTGEPECMSQAHLAQTVKAGKVITLVSSADSNIGGDWKTRGIMATTLALALSRVGYSTEMWADNFGYNYDYDYTSYQYQRIRVKGTADEINPDKLAFGFGDVRMLHPLAFANFDNWRWMGSEYGVFAEDFSINGRGGAMNRTARIEAMYPEGTIFITGDMLQGGEGHGGMKVVIEAELRKLGILEEV